MEAKRSMSSKEIVRYARQFGIEVETSKGKHSKHLVAPDGRRRPLPDHGRGIISMGVRYSLIKFIEEYMTKKEAA